MKTDIHLWSYLAKFFLEWEMFEKKLYRKSKHTFCIQQLFPKNRAVYEIMWENIVERGGSQMAIWRMRVACRTCDDVLSYCNTQICLLWCDPMTSGYIFPRRFKQQLCFWSVGDHSPTDTASHDENLESSARPLYWPRFIPQGFLLVG
jgi:hypothetical protein